MTMHCSNVAQFTPSQRYPRRQDHRRRLTTSRASLLALLLVGFLAMVATGTTQAAEPTGISVASDSVEINALGTYSRLSLTVREPDGVVSRLDADHADSLSFGLVDDEGDLRPEGLYSYELRGVDADAGSLVLGSGFFSIAGGSFVDPEVPERGLQKEYLDDDFYLNGSLCVGEDCQDGAGFGYATIWMEENNTRVVFDDTSSIGSFANNDWMLRANESSDGGADLFSIVDCGTSGTSCENQGGQLTIMAGAPENSLFVDPDGLVGLGTSVPEKQLHVRDGDTPTLRLQQDGSAGFQTQVWDIGANEAHFFVRDTTNSHVLPFRIEPGAPTNSLTVENTGKVGIGTWNPAATLDVRGDIAVTGSVDGRDVGNDGSTLDAHVADLANPHQVTAAQVGADPSGTAAIEAASAVTTHETAYDHGPLEAKAGKLWSGQFSGNPAKASVTFATPFPSGTNYIVLLTANTKSDGKAFKTAVRVQNDSGFTITLGGNSTNLHFVAWLAYPLN